VPGGFRERSLPVGISFLGRPFSESRLIGLAFDFERVTGFRRTPPYTPSLLAEPVEAH